MLKILWFVYLLKALGAVAREFGVTEEEYYKRKEDKANEQPVEKSSRIK